jgi:hypothetical protein
LNELIEELKKCKLKLQETNESLTKEQSAYKESIETVTKLTEQVNAIKDEKSK